MQLRHLTPFCAKFTANATLTQSIRASTTFRCLVILKKRRTTVPKATANSAKTTSTITLTLWLRRLPFGIFAYLFVHCSLTGGGLLGRFPGVDELSLAVVEVIKQLKMGFPVGLGVGVGADILLRSA